MTYGVTITSLLKTMGKFGSPWNPTNYISFERYWWELSEDVIFIIYEWIKSYGHLSKILAYFSQFLPDLSLIIYISRDHGCQFFLKKIISPGFPLNFRKIHQISKN